MIFEKIAPPAPPRAVARDDGDRSLTEVGERRDDLLHLHEVFVAPRLYAEGARDVAVVLPEIEMAAPLLRGGKDIGEDGEGERLFEDFALPAGALRLEEAHGDGVLPGLCVGGYVDEDVRGGKEAAFVGLRALPEDLCAGDAVFVFEIAFRAHGAGEGGVDGDAQAGKPRLIGERGGCARIQDAAGARVYEQLETDAVVACRKELLHGHGGLGADAAARFEVFVGENNIHDARKV